ncbi:MAG TPA: response regulator, partial [Terriglobales bacterium]|nr:response regulator [Terriglobales bacterium]
MGIKILLADDSVTAQNMGKKILSDAGHEVVTVSNGAAAAKKIAEIKPELVLLDVFMPGYSGLELCEKLRNAAETSKLPVLLTVGRMEPYNSQDGARVKADGVIVKPFEASDLTAAVDRLADKLKLKQQPGTSGSGITVVAKNETAQPELSNKQETTAVTTTSLTPVSEESKGYEKTVALNPAHIESVLKTGAASPEQEFAVPAREQVAEDFRVAPAMTAADVYSLDHSQSGTETKPQPPRASVPSYMAQYLAEPEAASAPASAHETLLDPAASAGPASPTVHDQPTSAFPIPNEFLLSHSRNEINEIDFSKEIRDEAPVGSIPGLEFTAAPPVPDVPIASEPGLELTLQPAEPGTGIVQDPALVTDPHHSKMDFPTRFGSSESELAQQFIDSLHASAEPVVDETDEFEARLGAAMASYEEPSAELPSAAEEPTSNVVEIRSRFTSEAAPATQRLEPQVDTSIHFDRPEVGSQPVAVRPGNPLDVPPVEVSDVN